MEVAGLTLGVAGLIAAFQGAVEGYLLIESFFDDDDGSGYSFLRYHIEKHKLVIWGQFFKTSDPANCSLKTQPDVVKQLIMRILGEIEKTHRDAEPYIKKYDLSLVDVPNAELDKSLQAGSKLAKELAKAAKAKTAAGRIKWVIKGRDEFSEIVTRLQQLNRDLYDVLQPGDVELLQKTLASYVLTKLNNTGYLKMIQNPKTQSPRLLTLSAQLKDMQQSAAAVSANAAKLIPSTELKLKDGTWTTGIHQSKSGVSQPVWIEWNILDPKLPSYPIVRSRAESLAAMVQTVDEASLRIPPCLGLYDDLSFEASHGLKRLGFVFTVPGEHYEENLRRFEPTTLKRLIRTTHDQPPLLGDRFKLAYVLASAFSLFHASGWLHKGFRSENIVFLHKSNGTGISIADPHVIGFQQSRAQDTESLKQSAPKNAEEEYYYHAHAVGGFTKELDLYSFGVVLCEIGRWDLLGDAVPAEKKDKLKDRNWATRYVTGQPLEDLGWRMGARYRSVAKTLLMRELPDDDDDYFAHEFFQKVIMPLEACTA